MLKTQKVTRYIGPIIYTPDPFRFHTRKEKKIYIYIHIYYYVVTYTWLTQPFEWVDWTLSLYEANLPLTRLSKKSHERHNSFCRSANPFTWWTGIFLILFLERTATWHAFTLQRRQHQKHWNSLCTFITFLTFLEISFSIELNGFHADLFSQIRNLRNNILSYGATAQLSK